MKKITLKVNSMHCKSCAMLIKDSLEEHAGIKYAKVSHETGTVEVRFDENKANETQIKSIIANEGYGVE